MRGGNGLVHLLVIACFQHPVPRQENDVPSAQVEADSSEKPGSQWIGGVTVTTFSAYEQLELVYLYRPLGIPLGERKLNSLSVVCRDGTPAELALIQRSSNRLFLYVLTPLQMFEMRDAVARLLEKQASPSDGIGFLLVDDPKSAVTVRMRKRIQNSPVGRLVLGDVRSPYSFNHLLGEINNACHHLYLAANVEMFSSVVAIRDLEAKSINEVGAAMLMGQSSTDELLRLVLTKAVRLSNADAGFLLLRENLLADPARDGNKVKLLRRAGNRFVQKYRICDSQNLRIAPSMGDPESSSLMATVVNRACGISWAREYEKPCFYSMDDYALPDIDVPMPEFDYNRQLYAIKSYCVFPLRTPSCEVVGVIFLVNRKRSSDLVCDSVEDVERHVTDFGPHDLNILGALSNQAGVSLDHARLYKDLRVLFESFVEASVVAIEARDPTTKGHSERVAVMTVGLAEAVNRTGSGPYGSMSFNPSQLYELRYAALLHDFGKIGVREAVLCKEKKLYPQELSAIRERLTVTEKRLQLGILEAYIEGLVHRQEVPRQEDYLRVRSEIDGVAREFRELWESIQDANEPNVVNQDAFQKIAKIAALQVVVGDEQVDLLQESEIRRLSLGKGSLSDEERLEIESHVIHSYNFLIQIPWSSDLANIPDIVYAHHERLNGVGYPRKLVDHVDEIPIQSKILAITDIYDALVSVDRPYKKAIPQQRALAILEAEVREGKLDPNLFRIFLEARICEMVRYPDSEVA